MDNVRNLSCQVNNEREEIDMETLKVEEMHCINCVDRISSALKVEAIEFEIKLEEKIVRVDPEKVELAIDLLDDLGFTATL